MITLSIITPTYNRFDKLKKNIDSVLSQSFRSIEHIIIDNLSDDGTDDLITSYKKKAGYPVIYIREKDNGVYDAMNKGIQAAKGIWIHILNSDDRYYSDKVISELFSKDLDKFDLVANTVVLRMEKYSRRWIPEADVASKYYNFPHTGIILRKYFYRIYGLYKENFKIISDSIYNIQHFNKAAYFINKDPLVIMSDTGKSSNFTLTNIFERLICIFVYHDFSMLHKVRLSIGTVLGLFSKRRQKKR